MAEFPAPLGWLRTPDPAPWGVAALALLLGCGEPDDGGSATAPTTGGEVTGGETTGGATTGGETSSGATTEGATTEGETTAGETSTTSGDPTTTTSASSTTDDTDDSGETGDGGAAPDFGLADVNSNSATFDEVVSPRDYLEEVSGWYFTHAT